MTDAAERSRNARRAALIRWSRATPEEARAVGLRAQAGLDARLLADIDPDGRLSPPERAVRLARARRAHFIALRAKARKEKP